MGGNGRQRPARPRIEISRTAASPEEAAAIAAAIEQFLKDTARRRTPDVSGVSPWLKAALMESVGLDPAGPNPWETPRLEEPGRIFP